MQLWKINVGNKGIGVETTACFRWLLVHSQENNDSGQWYTYCWCHLIPFFEQREWITQKQNIIWTASSKFGTYRICEQRTFRRACASEQSRQNLHCSLIQAVSQEEHSDRKPDSWPFWMAGHAQLKSVMTECSKTQIRLTGLILCCINSYNTIASKQMKRLSSI